MVGGRWTMPLACRSRRSVGASHNEQGGGGGGPARRPSQPARQQSAGAEHTQRGREVPHQLRPPRRRARPPVAAAAATCPPLLAASAAASPASSVVVGGSLSVAICHVVLPTNSNLGRVAERGSACACCRPTPAFQTQPAASRSAAPPPPPLAGPPHQKMSRNCSIASCPWSVTPSINRISRSPPPLAIITPREILARWVLKKVLLERGGWGVGGWGEGVVCTPGDDRPLECAPRATRERRRRRQVLARCAGPSCRPCLLSALASWCAACKPTPAPPGSGCVLELALCTCVRACAWG